MPGSLLSPKVSVQNNTCLLHCFFSLIFISSGPFCCCGLFSSDHSTACTPHALLSRCLTICFALPWGPKVIRQLGNLTTVSVSDTRPPHMLIWFKIPFCWCYLWLFQANQLITGRKCVSLFSWIQEEYIIIIMETNKEHCCLCCQAERENSG